MTEIIYPSGKKQITIQDDGSIYLYADNDNNTLTASFESHITRYWDIDGKEVVNITADDKDGIQIILGKQGKPQIKLDSDQITLIGTIVFQPQ